MVTANWSERRARITIDLPKHWWEVITSAADEEDISFNEAATAILESGDLPLFPAWARRPSGDAPARLKRDGTIDKRTTIELRPRINTVERQARWVERLDTISKKPGAMGRYEILLSCGHFIYRAIANGEPTVGKYYLCPQCSQKAEG